MKRTILIIVIAIAIVIAAVIAYGAIYYNRYVRNFFAANGVGLQSTYEEIVAVFGEPENITLFNEGLVASVGYEGVGFQVSSFCSTTSSPSSVRSLEVIDPKIRFSRHELGVGSTRQEIEQVDWWRWPMRFWSECLPSSEELPPRIVVTSGQASLWFHFDENDIVQRITMREGEHH